MKIFVHHILILCLFINQCQVEEETSNNNSSAALLKNREAEEQAIAQEILRHVVDLNADRELSAGRASNIGTFSEGVALEFGHNIAIEKLVYAFDPNWVDPNWVDPNWVDPNWVDPNWVDPNWIDPNWIDPNWIDPNWIDPNWIDPNDPNYVDPTAPTSKAKTVYAGSKFELLDSIELRRRILKWFSPDDSTDDSILQIQDDMFKEMVVITEGKDKGSSKWRDIEVNSLGAKKYFLIKRGPKWKAGANILTLLAPFLLPKTAGETLENRDLTDTYLRNMTTIADVIANNINPTDSSFQCYEKANVALMLARVFGNIYLPEDIALMFDAVWDTCRDEIVPGVFDKGAIRKTIHSILMSYPFIAKTVD